MVSKKLIQEHKEKIRIALWDLDYCVDTCSRETPRAVARVLDSLINAVYDRALDDKEQVTHKKSISDAVIRFEKSCACKSIHKKK